LPEAQVRGQLAWAFGATGALAWLPWTSVDFDTFAVALAGPVLAEALAAGVADGADGGGG
jgi:apolipoprotein N-acyltransferase